MPTNFFDLPRELRHQMYHTLWKHTHQISVPYGRGKKSYVLPLWLLVCKQVLHEGIEEFQFAGFWMIDSESSRQPIRKPGLLRLAEAHRINMLRTDLEDAVAFV
jgi:hypothetical protein